MPDDITQLRASFDRLDAKLTSLEKSINKITEMLSEMRVEERGLLVRLERLEAEYSTTVKPVIEAYYGLKGSITILKVVSTILGVAISIVTIITLVKTI